MLELHDGCSVEHFLDFRFLVAGDTTHDVNFLGAIRVFHDHIEEKTVKLCFGQGVGAFLLNRVLRRQHEERFVEFVVHTTGGYSLLLHCLKEGRLGLWWGPVNLIGKKKVGKNRTLHELELTRVRLGIFLKQLGAGNVGRHEIRSKLNPLKRQ